MAMRILERYGHLIDVNSQNNDGDTALVWASVNCLKDVIIKLLTYPNINVKHVTKNGNTAITVARLSDEGKEIKAMLMEFAGVDQNDSEITTDWIDFTKNGNLQSLQKMVAGKPKFDLNRVNSNGDTALIWAALKGHEDIVDWLLTQPTIDVNVVSKNGSTALLLAASAGKASICCKLCSRPEISRTINNQSNTKYNALIWACQTACEDAVEAILRVPGVQINLINEKNDPAFIGRFQKEMSTFVECCLVVLNWILI